MSTGSGWAQLSGAAGPDRAGRTPGACGRAGRGRSGPGGREGPDPRRRWEPGHHDHDPGAIRADHRGRAGRHPRQAATRARRKRRRGASVGRRRRSGTRLGRSHGNAQGAGPGPGRPGPRACRPPTHRTAPPIPADRPDRPAVGLGRQLDDGLLPPSSLRTVLRTLPGRGRPMPRPVTEPIYAATTWGEPSARSVTGYVNCLRPWTASGATSRLHPPPRVARPSRRVLDRWRLDRLGQPRAALLPPPHPHLQPGLPARPATRPVAERHHRRWRPSPAPRRATVGQPRRPRHGQQPGRLGVPVHHEQADRLLAAPGGTQTLQDRCPVG